MKEKFYISAFEEYTKRLNSFCNFVMIEIPEQRLSSTPKQAEIENALAREAEQIIKYLSNDSYSVAMCVEGVQQSSEELSNLFAELTVKGYSKIIFIIGGSFGLSEKVKSKANLMLSMSKMTFPHHLARVMLGEQIYRAFNIMEGTKYHK